eukprot:TRINITY_DN7290_c0_g1_i1.p2 TRINITY_DN7290_c0_g1~~TRINITY_DN7290_c0_g1_i1.p2  ORF type:complete len:213 (-),score=45.76 TRINITY_DN7290_c0_g1_i1:723-1361(-)
MECPKRFPKLIPETQQEQLVFHEAEQRKLLRKKILSESNPFQDSDWVQPEPSELTAHKKAKESMCEVTHLVLVSHANTIGVTFGGQIMAWMESCALIAAMRHSRRICITLSVDSLRFLKTVSVGDALIVKSVVNNVFHSTSMEVGVKVYSEDLMTGERVKCNHAFFTFLAVEDDRPTPVPALLPETPKESLRYQHSLARRRWRMERKVLFCG